MKKVRRFDAGGNTRSDDPSKNQYVDTDDIEYKAAGLAASNAELKRGDRKPSGFLGLGRFLEGDINQKGSEAYNKYGAGYGRELEAKNARLKEKTEAETKPAAPAATAKYKGSSDYSDTADMKRNQGSAAAPAAPAATAKYKDSSDYSDTADMKRNQGSAAPTKRFTRVTEDMPKTKPEGGAQVTTGDARVAEYANAFPSNRDEGGRAAKRGPGATTGSGTAAAKPPAAAKTTSPTQRSDREEDKAAPKSGSASGSGGGRGPTYAQVDAEKQRGFAANPMSKDPSQRAKPAAPAAKAPEAAKPAAAEKPLSPAQQKAKDAIARATGSSSGLASSRVPTAAEAEQNRASFAGKAGDAVSSVGNYFKNFETPADRRSRLAKEAKDKERSKFMKESGQKAGGGAIRGYASGGSVSASRRGDGIAQRGKTRGKMC